MTDLGLHGKSLQSVLIEHTVRMQLSDVYFIVIESPFRLEIHGNSFSLSPEDGSDALQPLRQLVGHTIEDATADAADLLNEILARRSSTLLERIRHDNSVSRRDAEEIMSVICDEFTKNLNDDWEPTDYGQAVSTLLAQFNAARVREWP